MIPNRSGWTRPHHLLWGTFCVLTLTICSFSQGTSPPDPSDFDPPDFPNILILHSYHQGSTWSDNVTSGINDLFQEKGVLANLSYEYMDTKRTAYEGYFEFLADIYREKYKNRRFDVIIASDDNALNFLLDRSESLFPGVPVVFCGINGYTPDMHERGRAITGVRQAYGFTRLLDVIRRLQPGTRRILAITDATPTGWAIRHELDAFMATYSPALSVEHLDHLSMPELRETVRKCPPDTVVLLLVFNRDREARTFSRKQSARLISRAANVPVYIPYDFYINQGPVGGWVTSGHEQGHVAAKLALRVINGENVNDIPVVTESPNRYMFDYVQMHRFGLDPEALPPGTVIINGPHSFYRQYEKFIWSVIFVITGLVIFIIILIVNIIMRHKAERSLQISEHRYRSLFEESPIALMEVNNSEVLHYLQDLQVIGMNLVQYFDQHPEVFEECIRRAIFLNVNYTTLELFKAHSLHELHKGWRNVFTDESIQCYKALLDSLMSGSHHYQCETTLRDFEGGLVHVALNWSLTSRLDKYHLRSLISLLDISKRKQDEAERVKLEQQILRAQKHESIGVLAGGIAHDFNNLLVGILGNADLALLDIPEDNPVHGNVEKIIAASVKASDLVRQMLTYSGKAKSLTEEIDLNKICTEIGHLISVSTPENVQVDCRLAEALPSIKADVVQIRQLLMNLFTNAVEAISSQEGNITIATQVMDLAPEELTQTFVDDDISAGNYICLEISDTGCGLSRDECAKIFDPFYSTKFPGRGLGLASVLGIVRAHQGAINVESQPQSGTIFKVYLPSVGSLSGHPKPVDPTHSDWKGTGTILVVDDESIVRNVVIKMLQRLGFETLVAEDGISGLEVFARDRDKIRLTLLDLLMPRKSGDEVFVEIRKIDPQAKVVIASGFNEEDSVMRYNLGGIDGFIQKPFELKRLTAILREVLGE